MQLVPITDMSPPLWYEVWNAVFDPQMGDHIGADPRIVAMKPSLEVFYQNFMNAVASGNFMAWAIVKDGRYRGHVTLEKSAGEWEIGTVLVDPKDWNSGMGVRATLGGLKWAFEENGAEWVIAFTQGKDPKIPQYLHRGGFRPFMHFHVMDRATWDARWRARRT